MGTLSLLIAIQPGRSQGPKCVATDFSSANHRFRSQLTAKNGDAAVEHLRRWTLHVHCVSRTDRGVILTIPQRKAIFFEIADEFAKRRQPCLALQAVGMARLHTAPGLGGFWASAQMRGPEAQSVNQFLLGCIRSTRTPLDRSRSVVFRDAVTRLAKPSAMQDGLRTADNVRAGAGGKLAQALLDTLDVLLILDFGKAPDDRRVSATISALRNREALSDWQVLWAAMNGDNQRPMMRCLVEIKRGRTALERNLIAARTFAGSRGACQG